MSKDRKEPSLFGKICYGLNCVPSLSNLYVEALTANVTIFGDKAFNKVFKIKSDYEGRNLIPQDLCPCKKKKRHKVSFLIMGAQKKDHEKTKGKGGHPQIRKGGPIRNRFC